MADKNSGRAVKAGIGYTIGNMLIKGITFLTIPLFTRLMSTEDYGIFNTFNSYMSILTIFVGLALHSSIKNAKYDFPGQLKKYTSAVVLLVIISFAVITLLTLILSGPISSLIAYSAPLLVLMAAEALGNSLMSLYNNTLAIDFRFKEYLLLSFIYSGGSVLLSVLLISSGLFGESSYIARIVGSVIPLGLISAYIIIRSFCSARPSSLGRYWKYGLAISLPLIPHGLSQILLNQCDRIMIKQMVGDAEAGLYSLAYNIATLFFVLITSADTAWTPWFYERMSLGDDRGIKKNTALYTVLMSVVCILIFVGGPFLVIVMGGEQYTESRHLIIPLIYAMYYSFLYTMPVAVEYYNKKTKLIAFATVLSAVLNIALNYACIKLFGYTAAAYTTVFCHAVYFLFHLVIAKRIAGRWVFDMRVMLGCIAAVTVAGVLSLVFLDKIVEFWRLVFFTPAIIIPLCCCVAILMTVALVNRKKLAELIKSRTGK